MASPSPLCGFLSYWPQLHPLIPPAPPAAKAKAKATTSSVLHAHNRLPLRALACLGLQKLLADVCLLQKLRLDLQRVRKESYF